MKKYYLTGAVLCLSLLAVSCNKENPANGGSHDAYISLELVGMSNMTKTESGTDGTQEGTPVESKISTAQILLCDTDTRTVSQTINVSSSQLIETSNGAKTQPIKVTSGTYDIFVVANPPAGFAVSDVAAMTIDAVTEALMKSDYAADNKFLMFSQCNASDDVKGEPITITEANDKSNPAKPANPIKLDRLAAKITSTATSVDIAGVTAKASFISAVELKGFKLVNGATKVNLQQEWKNNAATAGSAAPRKNSLISANDPANTGDTQNTSSEYANSFFNFRTIGFAANKYTEAVDKYDDIAYYNTSDPKGAIYCMENNPSYKSTDLTAKVGNTTGLVYQWQATVTGSDATLGSNTFYCANGEYFATLADIQTRFPSIFDSYIDGSAVTDRADALAAAKSELAAASGNQANISNWRVKNSIQVYADGIMYYTYFIKDQNYVKDDGTTKYYSVMRNTIYGLTVKKLLNPGTDIPGGWDPSSTPESPSKPGTGTEPDDPVEPTNVYLQVEVSVNPWVLSNEDIELK